MHVVLNGTLVDSKKPCVVIGKGALDEMGIRRVVDLYKQAGCTRVLIFCDDHQVVLQYVAILSRKILQECAGASEVINTKLEGVGIFLDIRKVEPKEDSKDSTAPPDVSKNPHLFGWIDELEVSDRARNCLRRMPIYLIGELVQRTEDDLRGVLSFGQKSIDEVKQALAYKGLALGTPIPNWQQLLTDHFLTRAEK